MTDAHSVVAATQRISKADFHARLMMGWARGIKNHGRGAFADKLEISEQALGKQLSGSMPSAEVLDRALDAEPTALDDWLAAKGKKLVDIDAVCDADGAALLLARLLERLLDAQAPDSPGGRSIVHHELLAMEPLLRDVNRLTGNLLNRCIDHRSPTKLRNVA